MRICGMEEEDKMSDRERVMEERGIIGKRRQIKWKRGMDEGDSREK